KAYEMKAPFLFEMSFQDERQTDRAAELPGLKRVNETTVSYTSPDFITGYRESKGLISMATTTRTSLLFDIVQARPDGKEILSEYRRRLLLRWTNPDAFAKQFPQKTEAAAKKTKKKFYGDT